jgi:hypothetical protein
MKQITKTSPLDAIRNFYISNELLGDVFKPNTKNTQRTVETDLKKIIKVANKLSKKELLNYHLDNYHPRYDNYLNSSWELKEISLADCGVWPKMGGLPDEMTRGSVTDAANLIRPYLTDKNKLTLATARILYIEEMMKFAEEITQHIPIVVLEDGVIRQMKLQKPENLKNYKKCIYDIDDGNHRALALALLGKTTVRALVGKRIYKSPLLY